MGDLATTCSDISAPITQTYIYIYMYIYIYIYVYIIHNMYAPADFDWTAGAARSGLFHMRPARQKHQN